MDIRRLDMGNMTLKEAINSLRDLSHTHSDSSDLKWAKEASGAYSGLLARLIPPYGLSSARYFGMFAITDASVYATDTFQLSIADTWDTATGVAGYAKVNDAILTCAKDTSLTIPAQFINAEEYKEIGYVVALFSLDGSENPQFDGFDILDSTDFETYTVEEAHYLIGRVYGIEVTDGSLVTTTIYFNQDHRGWIDDVVLKECP